MISYGIPWCLTHILKNNLAKLKVVVIILVGAIFANLENWSTTMKMASIPFHLGSYVMKSMETFSHGSFGIGRIYIAHHFLLYIDFVLWKWNTNVHKMLYILFYFGLVKFLSYNRPCGSFPTAPAHGHIMFFHAWFLCVASLLPHKFGTVSI